MRSAASSELPTKTLYWLFVVGYVTFQLISDVTAGKIVSLGPAVVSASVLYFPITYIISDVLTEVYGYERARRALWSVLIASIVAGLIYQLVVWLPPGPGFNDNAAFSRVLGSVPRILVAGWAAVFVGDIANNYIMSRLKVITSGKALWLRAIVSTLVGQTFNTTVFYIGALYGVLPDAILIQSIFWGSALKVAVEVLLLPITYIVIAKLKKHEGLDVYDRGANYNPFKI